MPDKEKTLNTLKGTLTCEVHLHAPKLQPTIYSADQHFGDLAGTCHLLLCINWGVTGNRVRWPESSVTCCVV